MERRKVRTITVGETREIIIKSKGVNRTRIFLDGKEVQGSTYFNYEVELDEMPRMEIDQYITPDSLPTICETKDVLGEVIQRYETQLNVSQQTMRAYNKLSDKEYRQVATGAMINEVHIDLINEFINELKKIRRSYE